MPKTALIRADGSKSIGLGHISRACLVSDMLQQRFGLEPKLVTKKNLSSGYFISEREIDTILLPEESTVEDEILFFRRFVGKESPSLFVLDVLDHDVNISYTKAVRELGCPVIAVTDDSQHRVIDVDVIINGNPSQLGQDYSGEPGRYLIGPKYFVMDSKYENIEAKEPEGDVKNILLTVGGSDHNNLLFRILDIIERMKRELSVMVVVSKASGYVDRLQEYLKQLTIHTQLFVDVKSLVSFWEQCDIAITAAGNTLFERIATRLPGATLCQLDRQMEIADNFESLEVNVNLGSAQNVSDDILSKRIADFIDNRELHHLQYMKSPQIIDGKGLRRFNSEVQSVLEIYQDGLRETDKTI